MLSLVICEHVHKFTREKMQTGRDGSGRWWCAGKGKGKGMKRDFPAVLVKFSLN